MNERRGPLLKSDDVDHGVVPNSERHTLPGRGFPYLDLFLGDSSFFLANDDRCAGNGEPANVRLYDSLLDDRFFVIMDGGSTQPRLLGFTWTRKRKPRKEADSQLLHTPAFSYLSCYFICTLASIRGI